MASEKRALTSESVLDELGARMGRDGAFVEQLRQNPVETLDALGIEVPPGVMLRLEPEGDGGCRLVVCHSGDAELTDEELSKVAGGVAMPNFTRLASSQPFKMPSLGEQPILVIAYGEMGV